MKAERRGMVLLLGQNQPEIVFDQDKSAMATTMDQTGIRRVSSLTVMDCGSRIGNSPSEGPSEDEAKLKTSLTAIEMDGKENSEVAFSGTRKRNIDAIAWDGIQAGSGAIVAHPAGQQRRGQQGSAEKEDPDAELAVSPVRRSSSMKVSPAHQTRGPRMRKTTRTAASAKARMRLRPACCCFITPSDVLTTQRVRSATAQSRFA
jgi:hypothetical protein